VKRLFREFVQYLKEHPDEVFSAFWQATRPQREVI
jgi:hypothetical protein